MEGVLLSLYFLLLKWFVIIIKAEETNITVPIILNETDMKNFNKTSILRYGFHRTHKCLDFQKTYVCINTCLERGFAIASADKDCKCTCFEDKIKSKYFGVNFAWKLPTTTKPAWVGVYLNRSKGEFVLMNSPHKNQDHLKHQTNESLSENNGTALYRNNSSEEHHNESHSDVEKGKGDAGGVDTDVEPEEKEDAGTDDVDVTVSASPDVETTEDAGGETEIDDDDQTDGKDDPGTDLDNDAGTDDGGLTDDVHVTDSTSTDVDKDDHDDGNADDPVPAPSDDDGKTNEPDSAETATDQNNLDDATTMEDGSKERRKN